MIKNGIYNVAGAVIRLILTFLTIPLLIRLIGVEEYGLWTLISTVLAVAGLAEGGLSISTTVFLSEDIANNSVEGISQTLTITGTAMLLLATLAGFLLLMTTDNIIGLFQNLLSSQRHEAISALRFSTIVLWAKLLQQVLIGIEQAYQKYGLMNFLNTFQVVLSSLGLIVIAWCGGKTLAFMQWQAAVNLLTLAMHGWASKFLLSQVKPKIMWSRSRSSEIVRYSLSTWFTSLGIALFQQGDRLIVGGILGTKELGIYTAITSVTGQINTLSSLPIQPILPEISKIYNAEVKHTKLQEKINKVQQANGIIALGIGSILLTFSPLIISLLISENAVTEYVTLFRISTIIYSVYSLSAVGYYVLLGLKLTRICLVIVLFSGALSLTMIAILSHYFGIFGAIIGNAGYIVVCLLNVIGVRSLNIRLTDCLKSIAPLTTYFLCTIILNLLISTQNTFFIIILASFQVIFLSLELLKLRATAV
jgi:O-antigen/teichoic acid export membrane protein